MKYNFTKELSRLIADNSDCKIIKCEYDNVSGFEYLYVSINVLEYPQFPVFEVRKTEDIKIEIHKDDLPKVYCRKDFPIVPHLNIYDNGDKTLCLYDVPYCEIKHFINPAEFLGRINSWFKLTARGELHQPGQPLEPFLEGSCNIALHNITDSEFVRIVTSKPSLGDLLTIYPYDSGIGELCLHLRKCIILNNKTYGNNIINKLPNDLDELCSLLSCDLKNLIDSFLQDIWCVRRTKYYKLVYDQSINKLKGSKVLISLLYTSKDDKEVIGAKSFLLNCDYWKLIVQFGYNVDGNKHLIRKNKLNDLKSIKVETFEPHFYLDKSWAKMFNAETYKDYKLFQIGLGTLGSKVADNLLRSGFGNWIYLDDDILLPHNISRHCLNNSYIGLNKAIAMQKYAEEILVDSPVAEALTFSFFDTSKQDFLSEKINEVDLVVDTSASVGVERDLCIDVSKNTRCVSGFLNPSATSMVILCEDKSRNIRLDDLEMQYYKYICHNKAYINHLKTKRVANYSSSCRNQSLSFSNDNATIFGGLFSKTLKRICNTDESMILLFDIGDSGINNENIPAEQYLVSFGDSWTFRFSKSVLNSIIEQRKFALPKETGGVVIGSFDFYRKICYVVDVIPAPDDSISSPMSFVRGCNGLKEVLDNYEDTTIGNLFYIGEWHSHPNNSTLRSEDDKILLNKIVEWNSERTIPGCMIIAGDDHISIYLKQNNVEDSVLIKY